MAKKEPGVSWQVLLDDAQWEQEAAAPSPSQTNRGPRFELRIPRKWVLFGSALLILAVVVAGLLFWQRAQVGLALMQEEIGKLAALESSIQARHNPTLAAALLDPLANDGWRKRTLDTIAGDTSTPSVPTVQGLELVADYAVVQLLVTDPDWPQPSRVTRFYREGASGWLRTPPVASFWGDGETWEGEHFVFRFSQRDRDAVLAAGPQIDNTYSQMRRSLGLPILPTRRVIVVRSDDQPLEYDFRSGELRQPSPQLLSLPTTVSDSNALFRSIIIYLINELVRESFDRYAYGRIWMWSNLTESGLRNWLQLESGVLAVDRDVLLSWLMEGAAQIERRFPPEVAAECQVMDSLDVRLFLLSCIPNVAAPAPGKSAALRLSRLTTTYDFDFAEDANTNVTPSGPMWHTETRQEIVATTTIFLYATEIYGVARLPAFLEALGDHRDWTGVLPAAYGVSVDEFEEGWRGWLAKEFGVSE